MPLTDDTGQTAVRAAREAIESRVAGAANTHVIPREAPFTEPRGVFVTINTLSPGPEKLRGCIGFPYAVKFLGEAIQEAAVAAATDDPRFPPVLADELNHLVIEVSILTNPVHLKGSPQNYPSLVKIGQDGLLISRSGQSGLLLPQVATEFGLDSKEFLSQACLKAGLPRDSWLEIGTEVQIFQAEVFAEASPRGEILRVSRES